MLRPTATILGLAGALALTAAPPALAAHHGRRHAHRTRALRIVATDHALSPVDHDHPRFVLSRRAVGAGLVRVTLVNRSRMMDHQAQLARLHPGVSVRDFLATARAHGDGAALALVDLAGGANTVAPGGRQTSWQRLSRGHYVVVCFVNTPDGTSHLDLGMVTGFRVTGRPTGPRRPRGHVAGTIRALTTASGMTFRLPRHFTGRGLYRFRDAVGNDPHELAIVRLLPGKTRQDVIDWFTHPGPPPFAAAGGFGAVMPHHGGWVRLHLQPGNYVATCFVPDDEPPHLPHGAMGMDVQFTVR